LIPSIFCYTLQARKDKQMNERLKKIRKIRGLTQEKAAELSGISLGTLRNWEQGIHSPNGNDLAALSAFYGVSTDTIVGTAFAQDVNNLDSPVLTPKAAGLLRIFENLNDNGQDKVVIYADDLLPTHAKKAGTHNMMESTQRTTGQ
jgi:transcriptional regulator with XRE-family HTH domain